MQVVHNCCCQQIFIQQLKLEQLINMGNKYTSIPLHGFMWNNSHFLFFLCVSDHNKLLELKTKLELGELMYIMTGMCGDNRYEW